MASETALIILTVVSIIIAIVAIIILIILAVLYSKTAKQSKEGFSESGEPVYGWTTEVSTLPANLVKNANFRIGRLGGINAGVPAPSSRSLYNPGAATSGRVLQALVNESASNPSYYDKIVNETNKPDRAPANEIPNAMVTKNNVIAPLSSKVLDVNNLA